MLDLAVLVSGGGTNLQAVIDAIEAGRIQNARIRVVISNNPGVRALERAEAHGIEHVCVSPRDYADRAAFHEALLATLKSYAPDLVVLAGWLVIVSPEMVEAFPNRIINIHPALIPAFSGTGYYGLHVHEAALARGVKLTGATVHFVDAETDGGPIILQKAVDVRADDTPQSLQKRVMEEAEWVILPEAIDLIARDRVRVEGRKVIISEA